jgi:addiction module RelE/StbE family toxin
MKIVWTLAATKDLRNIRKYISKDSVKSADDLVNKLYNGALILENNPRMGKAIAEVKSGNVRMLVSGNYITIYEIKEDCIYILNVCHSARLLENVIDLKDYG